MPSIILHSCFIIAYSYPTSPHPSPHSPRAYRWASRVPAPRLALASESEAVIFPKKLPQNITNECQSVQCSR